MTKEESMRGARRVGRGFTKEKELVEDDLGEGSVEFLSQVAVKKEEVLCVLKGIKIDKSLDPDGIYPRILREAREQIARVLTDIFVSSLATVLGPLMFVVYINDLGGKRGWSN
eukprot:g34912.t1